MTRKSPKGFTLIELLVVLGLIAVLIAILMPGIRAARDQSLRTTCMSNVRQLCMAAIAYANDNDRFLPAPNWASGPQEGAPYQKGWLYEAPNRGIENGAPAPWHRHAGLLWKYIGEDELYHCPTHQPPYVLGGPSVQLTSYLMNGAVCGYGAYGPPTYKLPRFQSNAIMYWETTDEQGGSAFNDGSSYPTENISERHVTGATIGCFDGHSEYIYRKDWVAEQGRQPGRLWCNPGSKNGA